MGRSNADRTWEGQPRRLSASRSAVPTGLSSERSGKAQIRLSSSSMVGQRMAASFGIEFPDGIVDGLIEVVRSGEDLVGEVMPLQVAPDPFNVVQLRSVFRQPLDCEPVSAHGEGGASRLAGVDWTVVEDQN